MRTSLLLALLSTGCVSKTVHDALLAEQTKTRGELNARSKALDDSRTLATSLQSKVDQLDARSKSLEGALADLQKQKDELDLRYNKAISDLAGLTKDKSKLKDAVEQMTAALTELEKRRVQAEARIAEYRSLLSKFQSLIDAGKLKVRIVEGRMVVVLATDILFASGSASLSRDGKAAISEVAQVLASIPRRAFQVEGHTDNVPIATAQFASNWELASARAINVLKAMVDAGMPKERISAASFADSKPVASNDAPEARAVNRRIEITIVPDLSALPGFDELQRVDATK